MKDKKTCVCCGQLTLLQGAMHEICEVCGWEDDEIQNEDPDYRGGANDVSLNEARKQFQQGSKE